ncbi:RiPP maturation radical SAM C-methyltransferase [Candidatus Margulisiibacteriota bacterium]
MNAPWANPYKPSMGLHILKQSLKADFEITIDYANLLFYNILPDFITLSILHNHFWDNPCLFWLSEGLFAPYAYYDDAVRSECVNNYWNTINSIISNGVDKSVYPRALVEWLGENKTHLSDFMLNTIPSYLKLTAQNYKSIINDDDILGFSCFFNQTFPSLAIAKALRDEGVNNPIIFGGASLTNENAPVLLKYFKQIDYVVPGEGEIPLYKLLSYLTNHTDINSIQDICYFRGNDKSIIHSNNAVHSNEQSVNYLTNLDDLPVIDYSDYLKSINKCSIDNLAVSHIPFETTRGCYWFSAGKCSFCGLMDNNSVRSKSVDNVYKEIVEQFELYNPDYFECADAALPIHQIRKLIPKLVAFFQKKEKKIKFFFEVRPNIQKKDICNFSQLGDVTLQGGIESFSTNFLKHLNKGIDALTNVQFIKWCSLYGVNNFYNLLFNHPGETKKDYTDSADLIQKIAHLQPPSSVMKVMALENSPIYRNPEAYGITNMKPWPVYNTLIPNFTDNDKHAFAYYFDFDYTPGIPNSQHYHNMLINAVTIWRNSYANKDYFLIMKMYIPAKPATQS